MSHEADVRGEGLPGRPPSGILPLTKNFTSGNCGATRSAGSPNSKAVAHDQVIALGGVVGERFLNGGNRDAFGEGPLRNPCL